MPRDRLSISNFSPQRLLEALPRARQDAVGLPQLRELLSVEESASPQLLDNLRAFVGAGLASTKNGRYWRRKSDLLIGTLRGTRSGHAFVLPDDPLERRRGDLLVNRRWMGAALHGDKVIARVMSSSQRGRDGRVETVLVCANPTVVGRFTRNKRECLVAPIEERILYDITVGPAESAGARDGDIVVVEITAPPAAGRLPRGRVIEIVGAEDWPGIDLEIMIRKHHLRAAFSQGAIEEAEAIPDSVVDAQIEGRIDLREALTVTIDGETARDFDDAVSLNRLPNGRFQLGVHIADVAFYVRDESALDEEAFERGTSVYFPERALPMLPERLSSGICSLRPRVDRLTMSVLLEMDESGRVFDYVIGPSVIHSRQRMTYTAVNAIIEDPHGEAANSYAHVSQMLLAMHELTLALIRRREQRGAIDFDLPEAELIFNDEGRIGGIVRAERNIAHRLIEEFMLLANETVAVHLDKLGVPLLYRVHEEPSPVKVEEFAEIAASFGHRFSMHGPVPQRGFQRLAREIEGRPEERMLSYLMLRSMQRARYSPQNQGHYGLAMKTYTHFTSPIRRYPDLIVHRILRAVLDAGEPGAGRSGGLSLGQKRALKRQNGPIFPESEETALRSTLEVIGQHSSDRERQADDAERELMDWRRAEFMAGHVGDEFDGVISTVRDFGFFVELLDVFVEGLVHVATIGGDYFEYEERKHRLVGTRSGRVFRLGDSVRVIVARVDRVRHRIELSLAGD
jgi:ribonuclease R